MTLSDVETRVRERQCVRGCMIHFASCEDFGKRPGESKCRGCAPTPVSTASAVCSKCFGRMRRMLQDAPDLIGRVRSLSDPTKAMVIEAVQSSSRSTEAPAPVSADLLDAADAMLANLRAWAGYVEPDVFARWSARTSGVGPLSAFNLALHYSKVIIKHLPELTANPEYSVRLGEALLVRHPEVEGERSAWSLTDAVDKWGIERRDRDRYIFQDAGEEDCEISATPVTEYYDPLLSIKDAAKRVGLTQRAIRKWTEKNDLPVATRLRGPRGTVMIWVYASEVDRVAAEMEARRNTGRPATSADKPTAESMLE